ncbi:peptidase C14, caspase domain-containing protein [Lactifluus volemus]|nr:peptidase C14, caspase domain-containing protein [Lactifluus volemus]
MGDFPGQRHSNSITRLQHPEFRFSMCTGRKKAVCIGINYTGQQSQLDGCVNDAKNMYRFLIDRLGFHVRDVLRLTDDAPDPRNQPTKANILGAMQWLVRGARKHDSLFIHYSGHGAQVRDQDGDEVSGYDEVIFPVDYSGAGTIIDDVRLFSTYVRSVLSSILHSLAQSCHSGSILGKCGLYHSDGRLRSSTVAQEFRRDKMSPAEVICWSGSSDAGTATDAHEGGIAVGAMSYAFVTVLLNNPRPSYEELLQDLRRATRKYHQKPQLTTTHHMVRVISMCHSRCRTLRT